MIDFKKRKEAASGSVLWKALSEIVVITIYQEAKKQNKPTNKKQTGSLKEI